MFVYIVIIGIVIIFGFAVSFFAIENERLKRENRQACLRESLVRNQLDTASREMESIGFREKSRADHQVMLREEKIAELERIIEKMEKAHRKELDEKDAEIRNNERTINIFKKQIDRLSGFDALEKAASNDTCRK